MGLDMYLTKKTYVWQPTKYGPEKQPNQNLKIEGVEDFNGKPINIDSGRVRYIIEEVGYWRKANAVHKWFVDNVQNGNDDCGEYYVNQDQMKELLAAVNQVLEASELVEGQVHNGSVFRGGQREEIFEPGKVMRDTSVAEKVLPATSGFFFGSTEYDQYYYQDLEDTKKILEACIQDEHGEYYYHSSW